ncbi:MAG: DUF1266 domain-containing protein [Eubacteriales bacterium]|nr:DUF1266 domain-containing protein [Eubacteriales bacterium]
MKHSTKSAHFLRTSLAVLFTLAFAIPVFAYGTAHFDVAYLGTPGNPGQQVSGDLEYGMGKDSATYFKIGGERVRNQWIYFPGDVMFPWSYFGEDGKGVRGWQQFEDGRWRYFDGGSMRTDWIRINQQYYYLDPVTGYMQTSGTAERDGILYAFNSDGTSEKASGLKNAENGGTEGWVKDGDNWYYLRNGEKVTSEWLIDGYDRYYVDENGLMCRGPRFIDGKLSYFSHAGIAWQDTSIYYNDKKYVFDSEGIGTETAMASTEEKMLNSNAHKWCKRTYYIYTQSQHYADLAAQIQNVKPPELAELLRRDWGISNKEQGLAVIQSLTESGKNNSSKSAKAWDLCRAMLLCESMEQMNWITKAEQVDMQLAIAPFIQQGFTSWDDYFDSYMEAFRVWSSNSTQRTFREKAYQEVKDSSVFTIEWNQPLAKWW